MNRGMRLPEAKSYVAEKLGVSLVDLVDPIAMHEVRRDLGLGRISVQELAYPNDPGAMESKFRIADVLGIPVNCAEKFRQHAGLRA